MKMRVFGVLGLGIILAECGSANSTAAGMNQFTNVAMSDAKVATGAWTVYVAQGTVTTGWWWYRRQIPVVYAEVRNTSGGLDSRVAIHFGKTTIRQSALASGGFAAFSLNASRIPAKVSISWVRLGISHHVAIPAKALIDVSSFMS
ncbi:MAG: hypothetical protein M1272_04290 [Firmicutes bacterium]|nr:hypothetical protein [Bacillota bacterium]